MTRAAIFASNDPAATATKIVTASLANIALNVPAGGCWRVAPATCVSPSDVPPLGQLPTPAAPANGQ